MQLHLKLEGLFRVKFVLHQQLTLFPAVKHLLIQLVIAR